MINELFQHANGEKFTKSPSFSNSEKLNLHFTIDEVGIYMSYNAEGRLGVNLWSNFY